MVAVWKQPQERVSQLPREPQNGFVGWDDVISIWEVTMSSSVNGKPLFPSPWSETMACGTLRMYGTPGNPVSSQVSEYAEQPRIKEERQIETQEVGWHHSTGECG